jgi:hypothetical protein
MLFFISLQHHVSKLNQIFLIYFSKCSSFSTIQCYAPNASLHQFLPMFNCCLLMKRESSFRWMLLFQRTAPLQYVYYNMSNPVTGFSCVMLMLSALRLWSVILQPVLSNLNEIRFVFTHCFLYFLTLFFRKIKWGNTKHGLWRRIIFHLNYLYTHGDGEGEKKCSFKYFVWVAPHEDGTVVPKLVWLLNAIFSWCNNE